MLYELSKEEDREDFEEYKSAKTEVIKAMNNARGEALDDI